MDKELVDFKETNENMKKSSEKENKKCYTEPTLIEIGVMQKITLGGSTPNPDSGGGPGLP